MPQLLISHSVDPTLNLALEELLATEATQDIFMLWRNDASIIVGRHQNTSAEIDESFVRARNIRVVRRITGGGAVYHDLGNINFSCISLERTWDDKSAIRFTAPIIHALKAIGLDAQFSGRNDILANNCKISGCARSVTRGHTLFHGTLLFDVDLSVLAKALKPDPDKIRSKGIKSVRARVGNIIDMLDRPDAPADTDEFLQRLQGAIQDMFGQPFATPPGDLLAKAEALANEKYRTWEWNFGTSLQYDFSNKLVFQGGIIQANLNVQDNAIQNLKFTGDFFGSSSVDQLVDTINGTRPRRGDLVDALKNVAITEYISGITLDQLVNLLAISD